MSISKYDTPHTATLGPSASRSEDYGTDSKDLEPHVSVQATPDMLAGPHTAVHRSLRVRHIQLIAISGAIGAGVFISIGGPLTAGGPLALLIGVSLWCFVIWCFSNCVIEMCTLLPVSGGYIYYAGRFLDPAARFAAGYNFILGGISFVCFELTALHVVVQYWAPDLSPAVMITTGLVGLILANGFSARVYGEIEFWISILKVVLMLGLFLYTFITMLGGNPIKDRYGFRYWRDPGLFAGEDAVSRLQGIWSGVTWGAFAVAGPEFISMVSGETARPRRVLSRAFNSTIYRVLFFYVGSCIAVAINCPYDSPALLGAIASGAPGAAKSPVSCLQLASGLKPAGAKRLNYMLMDQYIINMKRMEIKVLPDIVNAIVLTSIFSTGSSFMFASSRALHMLALEGQAPKIFARTNKRGTPFVAVGTIALFGCLSYLSMSENAAKVLVWFTNLTTACTLMTWIVIGCTYLRFRAGLFHQGVRGILPQRGYFQPVSGWFATVMAVFTLIFSGSYLMSPGAFTIPDFIFSYFGVFFWIFTFTSWKIKGLIRGEQRGIGIPLDQMDFETGLEEIEKMTEEEDRKYEAQNHTGIAARIDRILF